MKKLMKAASWAAAPKAMFAVKNPKKAALIKAGQWAAGRVTPDRKHTSNGMTAAKGLGAAVAAIPLGMWLGRMMERKNRTLKR
ncbi:MAG TPA: hypothetical protein VFI91_10215 [Longimicrobiaceae bacterium]|nr:hypothetical protein [Longimicrobiaceae bacterium]